MLVAAFDDRQGEGVTLSIILCYVCATAAIKGIIAFATFETVVTAIQADPVVSDACIYLVVGCTEGFTFDVVVTVQKTGLPIRQY